MFMWLAALARKIRQSRQGAVAILMGLITAAIIGMSALGVDIGFVIYKHGQMQSAADAAAFGAGIAIAKGYPADFRLEARALTAAVGFVNGASGVVVIVNKPPATGPNSTNQSAVEVLITQPQTLSLVSLYRSGLFNLGVRSVALAKGASYCLLGLDPTASGAVFLNNNASVSGCGVGVNSSSATALILNSNASITGPVSAVGNWSLASGATLGSPKTAGSLALKDPFSGVTLSDTGAPLRVQPVCLLSCTLQPGYYSLGLAVSNGVTLNFATSGVYYIGTQFTLGNNVTVNANAPGGVTIVIDGNYQINLGNNDIFNLTAPSSGPTNGIALASIRTATASVNQKFSNNAIVNLTGAIYFPNQTVEFNNGTQVNTSICGQLLARVIKIYNNATLKTQCAVPIIGGGAATLVE
jgi:hypothetical protein